MKNNEIYDDPKLEKKAVFETTNRFHLIHSLALLTVPLFHKPALVFWFNILIRDLLVIVQHIFRLAAY